MIGAVDCGMIVMDAMGVHTINPVSGDFSIGVSGISVKGGNPVGPVKEAVISGNILDLLSSIEAVGDDLKYYGSLGSPSLLVSGIDLSA
jgi:PmbA protein